jgi:hypothetical protein
MQPECSRDACLARAPHSAPPHRRRLHVQASTGLAPTPPDKMPASRFRYSPNALAMRASTCTPQRTATHKTPARTGQYRPVLALHPRPPIKCLHHDSDTAQMLVRDHVSRCVLARAPHIAPPHRRRLDVQAGTGLAPTPPDKMPASRFRYSPNSLAMRA